ncbi:MAG: hypothetical protein HY298_08325 [Verrucomicrobia bacterium]|nr:hypothetical protein [Verrucomicrobiota bacterium]
MFQTPILTRRRIRLAYAVAITADALQLLLGPFGWTFVDQVIDVVAMILTTALLGFHPLLLPTFIIEFIPVLDMLPTWTGCVALVVSLRKKRQPDKPPNQGPVIDV